MPDRSTGNRFSAAEVNQLRESIEHLYKQYCGVIANSFIPPVRKRWQNKYEPRLATIKKYVDDLAALIPDQMTRKQFESEAARRMINWKG